MKTLLLLITLVVTSTAAPYGNNIPLPTGLAGDWNPNPNRYTVRYDSFFGGHWNLTRGKRLSNHDGSYTDQFSGTVSNTSLNGTFTQSDFTWLSDSWFLDARHVWIPCTSFSVTISGGSVSGNATFRP